MNKTAYVVGYSKGSYEDYHYEIVFVTFDKKKATKWCTKFNNMLKKWKLYYDKYTKNDGIKWYDSDKYGYDFYDRWYQLSELNRASYNEHKLR